MAPEQSITAVRKAARYAPRRENGAETAAGGSIHVQPIKENRAWEND